MSDVPQGPGWWQASDDKWYPPPRPTMPGEEDLSGPASSPPPGLAPPGVSMPPGVNGPPPGMPPPGMAPPGYPPGAQPGPYGGPPAHGAPRRGSNRTPLLIVVGLVIVALIVALVVVLTSDDDGDNAQTVSTTAPGGAPSSSGPPASDGGGGGSTETTQAGGGSGEAQVADSGFTNFTSSLDSTNRVSYAYILENSTDAAIANLEVSVRLLDAQGTVVYDDTDYVYLLAPGAQLGLGDETFEEVPEVTDIQVSATVPDYAGPATQTGELSASDVSTTQEDTILTTTFTAQSTYEVELEPYAYVVYRNAEGQIVGGKTGFTNVLPAGGSATGEVVSYDTIPGVDPAQTQVYLDPSIL